MINIFFLQSAIHFYKSPAQYTSRASRIYFHVLLFLFLLHFSKWHAGAQKRCVMLA